MTKIEGHGWNDDRTPHFVMELSDFSCHRTESENEPYPYYKVYLDLKYLKELQEQLPTIIADLTKELDAYKKKKIDALKAEINKLQG